MATQPQINYFHSLVAERMVAFGAAVKENKTLIDAFANDIHIQNIDTGTMSEVIKIVKNLPKDPNPEMPAVVAAARNSGTNSRAGICTSCNNTVAPNEGYWYTKDTGGYGEHHKAGACPEARPVVTITEGVWRMDGAVWYVQPAKSGYLTARMVTERGLEYVRGGVKRLSSGGATPIVGEELQQVAAQYGALHSHCIFCSRDLTDERSDPKQGGVGYGPVCANKYGLPWGNVTLSK